MAAKTDAASVYPFKRASRVSLFWPLSGVFLNAAIYGRGGWPAHVAFGALFGLQLIAILMPAHLRRGALARVEYLPAVLFIILLAVLSLWVGLLVWGSAVVFYLFMLLSFDGGYVRLGDEGFCIKRGYRERFLSYDVVGDVEVKTPGRWTRLLGSSRDPYVEVGTSVRPRWPFSGAFSHGLHVCLEPGRAENFAEALKARLKA
jgi:hypothetical protein